MIVCMCERGPSRVHLQTSLYDIITLYICMYICALKAMCVDNNYCFATIIANELWH